MSVPPSEITQPLAEVLATCEKNLCPSQVCLPGTVGYKYSTNRRYYWSSCQSTPGPAFVVQPASANDVQIVMKAIAASHAKYPGKVPFAVKAGGHFSVPGSNSGPGVLIDLVRLNQVKFNEGTCHSEGGKNTVDVGPGQIWDKVYDELEPTGYNVNGATTCKGVGVAGFLLGAGYGNKTPNFGVAIDNIESIDVVLPTGEYVQGASETNDWSDLFWALKGGGNNFGIVTNWRLSAHSQPDPIYAEKWMYEEKEFPRLVDAIYNFSLERDPLANVEAIFQHTYTAEEEGGRKKLRTICQLDLYYDGPLPWGKFFEFENIPHSVKPKSTTFFDRQRNLRNNNQTYGSNHDFENLPPPFRGRYSSVMISHFTKSIITLTLEQLKENATEEIMETQGGLQIYTNIWPLIPSIFDKSPPSAWPHSAGNPSGPLILNFKWVGDPETTKGDEYWMPVVRKVTKAIWDCAVAEELTKADTPAYYNLVLDEVPAHDIYQGNMARLSQLRTKFDPQNVMSNTRGFRIPLA